MKQFKIVVKEYKDEMRNRSNDVYKKIETEEKIWYIPVKENAGEGVHVMIKSEDPNRYFKGYGGSSLTFPLEDGTVDTVKGPWHSNTDSLLSDTGIDLRDTHYTFGAVGKSRTHSADFNNTYIDDVLYEDEDWVIGSFNRIKNIAQNFANDLNSRVWYYSQSAGGSSTCWLDPER